VAHHFLEIHGSFVVEHGLGFSQVDFIDSMPTITQSPLLHRIINKELNGNPIRFGDGKTEIPDFSFLLPVEWVCRALLQGDGESWHHSCPFSRDCTPVPVNPDSRYPWVGSSESWKPKKIYPQ